MSEELNKKIQQVAELLGQDNMPENVKGLLSMLVGSLEKKDNERSEKENDTGKSQDESEDKTEEKSSNEDSAINSDILNKVKTLSDTIRGGNDPRINLLHAIKPFMNSKRQKKIGNCIQLLQMTSIAKLMDNQEK